MSIMRRKSNDYELSSITHIKSESIASLLDASGIEFASFDFKSFFDRNEVDSRLYNTSYQNVNKWLRDWTTMSTGHLECSLFSTLRVLLWTPS
jgi:hypothetical protein